ncbi:MAG TPA: hypothetical protein PLO52_01445 [Flavobacterium alvei]|nr:hypothetical protein [Flavobacterium alvei]
MSGEYSLRNNLQTDWIKHDSTWKKGVDQNWKNIDWSLYKIVDQVVANIAALPSSPTNYQAFIVESENEVWVWNNNITDFDRFPLSSPFVFYDLNLAGWYQWLSSIISPFGGAGGGDFFGPASAVDENVVIFDGPSGKIGKDSGVAIADVIAAVAGLGSPNYDLSNSCNIFNGSNTVKADVTNLSCTLTTSGRPVALILVGDGSPLNRSYISISPVVPNSSLSDLDLYFLQGSTTIYRTWFALDLESGSGIDIFINNSTIWHAYVPPAGTYTWKVQASTSYSNSQYSIRYKKLLAIELK